MNDRRRAAAYTRVSSQVQAGEDRVSLEEQRGDIEAYASEHSYEIVVHYQDVASGVGRDRPEFLRLQSDARAGQFDTILAWNADRLARSGAAMDDLLTAVSPYDITVETVRGTFDRRYAELLASVARMERNAIVERTVMGRRAAAKAGKMPSGRPPYGFRRGADGRPVIHAEEGRIVRLAFTSYLDGMSVPAISVLLQAETGRAWPESRLHKLLGQSAYAGTWVWSRRRRVHTDDGDVLRDQPEANHINIAFPQIVAEEEFDRVQALKRRRSRFSPGRTKTFYLLAGLVVCLECGYRVGGLSKLNGKRKRRYYRCHGQKAMKTDCRPYSHIRADKLEGLIWDEAKAFLTDPDSFWDKVDSDDSAERLDRDMQIAQREFAKVEGENSRLIRLLVTERITEAEFDHQRKFVTERLEGAQEYLAALRTQQAAAYERAAVADSISAWARGISEGLDSLDGEARREVLRQILQKVTIDRQGLVRSHFVYDPTTTGSRRGTLVVAARSSLGQKVRRQHERVRDPGHAEGGIEHSRSG